MPLNYKPMTAAYKFMEGIEINKIISIDKRICNILARCLKQIGGA